MLLIAEILTATELAHFSDLAQQLGMVALIELYDPDNLPAVLATGTSLIGVNNRDLRTFEVDLGHTVRLRDQIPENILLVGESGIHSRRCTLSPRAWGQCDAGWRIAHARGEHWLRGRSPAGLTRELTFFRALGGGGTRKSNEPSEPLPPSGLGPLRPIRNVWDGSKLAPQSLGSRDSTPGPP